MTERQPKLKFAKKYAHILDPQTITQMKPLAIPSLNASQTSEIIERAISTKREKNRQSLSSFPNLFASSSKPPSSLTPRFTPRNLLASSLQPSPNNSIYNNNNENQTERLYPSHSRGISLSRQSSKRERNIIRFEKDSIISGSGALTNSGFRTPRESPKDVLLQEVYEEARVVTSELRAIVLEEYDQKLDQLIHNFKVKEFSHLQTQRLRNFLTIVENKFIGDMAKNSPFYQETWRRVALEVSKIKSKYDEFLYYYAKVMSNSNITKEKPQGNNIWDALKLVVDHSELYRLEKTPSTQANREELIEELKRNIYNFKLEHKSQLNVNHKALEVFEIIEGHIRDLNNAIDLEDEKNETLKNENKKLSKQYLELESRFHTLRGETFALIDKRKEEILCKLKDNTPEFEKQAINDHIKDLERDLKRLTSENEKLHQTLETCKEENKTLTKQVFKVKKTRDIGVMIGFNAPADLKGHKLKLSSYLIDPQLSTNGNQLSEALTTSIISLIYSDKLVTDLLDDSEKRPRKPMDVYTVEWFMRRFGLYQQSETLIKDFIYTIKITDGSNDRFQTFLLLLGLDPSRVFALNSRKEEDPNLVDKKRIKALIYKTAETSKFYLKLASQLRLVGQTSQAPHRLVINDFGPFLPSMAQNQNFINAQAARNILTAMMKEQNFSAEESENTINEFSIIQQQAFQASLAAQNGGNQQSKPTTDQQTKDKEKEEVALSFDKFSNFMIDSFVEHHTRMLEHAYTCLKANTTSQNDENLSYDEFKSTLRKVFPKRSSNWCDHAFADFMDEPFANQKDIYKLLPNLVKIYFNENQAKDIYQQLPLKKDLILTPDSVIDSAQRSPKRSARINNSPEPTSLRTQASSPVQTTTQVRDHTRQAFHWGSAALDEISYRLYDPVSSLIVLQEMFSMLEHPINEAIKENDGLRALHGKFLQGMSFLPQNLAAQGDYNDLKFMKKNNLINNLENLWEIFRSMLVQVFRKNKTNN